MIYGSDIGRKFYEDGSVRRYPGNTVVADVTPDNPAYDVMMQLHNMIKENDCEKYVILLPSDSYHMTVISGLNDQVRDDAHWPPELPKDLHMTKVDDYIEAAVSKFEMPRNIRMKFYRIAFGKACMIARLTPADEEQNRILRDYRDAVAREIGFKLPNHDNYTFHISLGYTHVVPEGEESERVKAVIEKMNALMAEQPEFVIPGPYMAFYNDMHYFSPTRLPRD